MTCPPSERHPIRMETQRLSPGLSMGSPIERPLTNWTVYGSLELLGIIVKEREALFLPSLMVPRHLFLCLFQF